MFHIKNIIKNLRNRFLFPVLSNIENSQRDIAEIKTMLYDLSFRCEPHTTQPDNRKCSGEQLFLYMDAITTSMLLNKKIQNGTVLDYEEILEEQYTKLINPGDCVLDIGAHSGRHLQKFINLVKDEGKVFAFEPLKSMYDGLCHNYNYPNIKIYNLALSDSAEDVIDFYENEEILAESGLKKRIYSHGDGKITISKVKVTTLNNLASEFSRIDYIKIDVEGAEMSVLRGSTDTINAHRPVISVEYGYAAYSVYGETKRSLYDFCAEINYCITDIYGNIIPTYEIWDQLCDSIYWDYFVVPSEKLGDFFKGIHFFDTLRVR